MFVTVPRGLSIGTIEVHSTKMTFNVTTLTYRIVLLATVPVYNPNYFPVGGGQLRGAAAVRGCCSRLHDPLRMQPAALSDHPVAPASKQLLILGTARCGACRSSCTAT